MHLNFILNIDMFPDLLAPSSLLKSQDDQDADAWMETVDLKVWRIKAFHIFTGLLLTEEIRLTS